MTDTTTSLSRAAGPMDPGQPLRKMLFVILRTLDRAVPPRGGCEELPAEWFRYPPI